MTSTSVYLVDSARTSCFVSDRACAGLYSYVAVMPTNCCVYGCKTTKRAGDGISLHSFPDPEKSPERFTAWIQNINRKDFYPSKFIKVCSKHFTEKDYEPSSSFKKILLPRYKGPRILVPTAVPTLNLRGESVEDGSDFARERKQVEEEIMRSHIENPSGDGSENFPDESLICHEIMRSHCENASRDDSENSADENLKCQEFMRSHCESASRDAFENSADESLKCHAEIKEEIMEFSEVILEENNCQNVFIIPTGVLNDWARNDSLDHVRTQPNEHDTIRSEPVQSNSHRAEERLPHHLPQMAVPTPTPFFNKAKLVKAVAERRILWDQKSEHYFNRELSKVAWDHVAKEVGTTSEMCKKKWRGLRDTFIKEYRKMQKENSKVSTWRYYNKLFFLTDQIKHYKGSNNDGVDQFEATLSQEEYTQLMNERHDDGEVKTYPELVIMEEDVKREVTTEDEDNSLIEESYEPEAKKSKTENEVMDSDYHFLMSLLPTMRLLPQRRKNLVRLKILNVLCEEESAITE